MPGEIQILTLNAAEVRQYRKQLANILLDCVQGGASVSFMASLTRAEAEQFFENAADQCERGDRVLLAAFAGSVIAGTVQVITAMQPNQPHRAEVAKLLVLRSARGQGIGRMLMEEAERECRKLGKSLMVLDTADGSAERLYLRLGWTRVGVIPNYALFPDGSFCDTTIFYKDLLS